MSNSGKTLAGFIIGAAVGVAVGYFLNSDMKDEYVEAVKDKAGKLKEKAGELKNKVKDKLSRASDQIEEVAAS
jgi:hypothetical protein